MKNRPLYNVRPAYKSTKVVGQKEARENPGTTLKADKPYFSDGFEKMHLSSIANTSFAFFTMRSLPCLSLWLYSFATLPDTWP